MKLEAAPISHVEANRFVVGLHRHNGALPTSILRVAAIDEEGLVHGVAIAGLPKARMLCRYGTLEVNRVCSDGTANCCSFLYGAIRRAAKALGYRRLVTYTVAAEDGASLKASGWEFVASTVADNWRRRGTGYDQHDTGPKNRWEIRLGDDPPDLTWPVEAESPQMGLFVEAA